MIAQIRGCRASLAQLAWAMARWAQPAPTDDQPSAILLELGVARRDLFNDAAGGMNASFRPRSGGAGDAPSQHTYVGRGS